MTEDPGTWTDGPAYRLYAKINDHQREHPDEPLTLTPEEVALVAGVGLGNRVLGDYVRLAKARRSSPPGDCLCDCHDICTCGLGHGRLSCYQHGSVHGGPHCAECRTRPIPPDPVLRPRACRFPRQREGRYLAVTKRGVKVLDLHTP